MTDILNADALAGVAESAVFLQLFNPLMVDEQDSNLIPVAQLGAAVLLDKPIVLLVRPEHADRIPNTLRQLAAGVVVGSVGDRETTERLVSVLRALGVEPATDPVRTGGDR